MLELSVVMEACHMHTNYMHVVHRNAVPTFTRGGE